MNKTIQGQKVEIETIRKSQKETIPELENLEKRSGVIDASINNKLQEKEERTSGVSIEKIGIVVKENAK